MNQSFAKRLPLLSAALIFAAMVMAGPATARAGDYRTIEAGLKNETPLWMQSRKSSGHPVGCGPAAWAIVLGYWKQHKGKSRLLPGVQMPHAQTTASTALAQNMAAMAKAMGSTYGVYQGKKWGRTTPSKMEKIKGYLGKQGYRVYLKRLRGTEFDKFRKVKEWLRKDRPVIVLTNDPKKALSTLHYPVIEKARLKQKKVAGKWRDRDVSYYVNLGNGKRKWIWVREMGKNQHKHTGSFSMFFLNFK